MHRHLETYRAKVQAHERVDLPYFNCNTDKPMMEMVADSNVWYQAAILRETANEIRVLFPGTNHAKHWPWHTHNVLKPMMMPFRGDVWPIKCFLFQILRRVTKSRRSG